LTKKKKLTSSQIRHLRALGHHLNPKVYIGREGIDENLLKSVAENIRAHELIKVKIGENSPLGRKETAKELAAKSGCEQVQVIGRVCLLYRPNPEITPERRISLP